MPSPSGYAARRRAVVCDQRIRAETVLLQRRMFFVVMLHLAPSPLVPKESIYYIMSKSGKGRLKMAS